MLTEKSVDMKAMFDTWERAAAAWSDVWMKSPAFLQAMGKTLEAQLGLKAQANRWTEDVLEMWKIPSGRDIATLAERIAAVEDRLAKMESAKAGSKA
jgi:hypothetical protein